KLKLTELGEAIPPEKLRKAEASEHDEHGHHHGDYDPHVWLGIPEAILMVNKIAEKLGEFDKPHAKDYEEQARKYVAQLEQLQADGKKALEDVPHRTLVTTHDALGYFARTFDLEIVGFIQPRAGADTDARAMADLAKLMKEKQVRVIATEPQYPKRDADTLLQQLKDVPPPSLVEVDPLETVKPEDLGAEPTTWYERKMRHNIEELAKALK